MALKNEQNLSEFGNRLMQLMKEKGCETPKALAISLLDRKLVVVNTRGTDPEKSKENAIGSIEKKIRNHLHAESPSCLQGEFVNAYCKFFDCSADYLFAYTKVKSADIDARDICEKTGLSEDVVLRMIQTKENQDTSYLNQGWSEILESPLYYEIIDSWQGAKEQSILLAEKEEERKQLLNHLKKLGSLDENLKNPALKKLDEICKAANAAYAGLLFSISRNFTGFIEQTLHEKPEKIKKTN